MTWLTDVLTYQSDSQRWGQIFGGIMLACSAVMIFFLMLEIRRKPMLDKALTVKQFWLALLGVRIASATYFSLKPELWGTVIIIGLGLASVGVMVETIRERWRDPGVWEDPYLVIAEKQRIIEAQSRELANLRQTFGLSPVMEGAT